MHLDLISGVVVVALGITVVVVVHGAAVVAEAALPLLEQLVLSILREQEVVTAKSSLNTK